MATIPLDAGVPAVDDDDVDDGDAVSVATLLLLETLAAASSAAELDSPLALTTPAASLAGDAPLLVAVLVLLFASVDESTWNDAGRRKFLGVVAPPPPPSVGDVLDEAAAAVPDDSSAEGRSMLALMGFERELLELLAIDSFVLLSSAL